MDKTGEVTDARNTLLTRLDRMIPRAGVFGPIMMEARRQIILLNKTIEELTESYEDELRSAKKKTPRKKG